MEEMKIEDLVGAAKEFTQTPFGKYLMEQMNDAKDSTLRNGMNSDVSDEQLKAINYAAGIQSVTDIIDQFVYLADHPDALASTLKQTR